MRLAASFLAAVFLVAAPSASAKGGGALLFDRAAARAGDRLAVSAAHELYPRGYVVWLVRLEHAPRFFTIPYTGVPRPAPGPPPRRPGLTRLGVTEPDGHGGARLEFRLPHLDPGRYTLVVWCRPCGTHWAAAAPNYIVNWRTVLRVL